VLFVNVVVNFVAVSSDEAHEGWPKEQSDRTDHAGEVLWNRAGDRWSSPLCGGGLKLPALPAVIFCLQK
jgi:hypothetical protein